MSLQRILTVLFTLSAIATSASANEVDDAVTRAMAQVNRRLDALENQNQELAAQVAQLTRQNETLRAQASTPAAVAPSATQQLASTSSASPPDEWASRIRFNGDFRFRHESIDNELLPTDRTRETIRAHLNAGIKISDSIKGEVGIGTGGLEPRAGSATLGAAESRKEIGLDLAYMSWRPTEALTFTLGKMREPYVRPGRSLFFDNEIRPEGVAVNYKDSRGIFGNAFSFWLEERALASDSMLRGGQIGWDGAIDTLRLKVGAGYYDYVNVQGRYPGFANSLVSDFGNTIVGSSASARYVYDYNIGQLFAEATLPVRHVPFTVFADYGHNFEATNGLDTAYSVGLMVGKASGAGQWEGGVMKQQVQKDALFAQWTDSDFGGGVTDNDGYVWRLGWMAMKNLLVNFIYMDTQFNVDVGNQADYDRWQIEANFTF
jgi:cell division protein FtsB